MPEPPLIAVDTNVLPSTKRLELVLVARPGREYFSFMRTVKEIQAALPELTAEELRLVDAALREEFRTRRIDILYDDAYGTWTEEDQASAGAEAFALMEKKDERHGST